MRADHSADNQRKDLKKNRPFRQLLSSELFRSTGTAAAVRFSRLAKALAELVARRRVQDVLSRQTAAPTNQLADALRQCRNPIIAVAIASALVNVLYLTGAIYMMEVYDRVLASRSVPTLIGSVDSRVLPVCISGRTRLARTRLLSRVGDGSESNSGSVPFR